MHESDRVMCQFRFWQIIPPSPQDIEALHKVNLRGEPNKIDLNFTSDISTFRSTELTTSSDYKPWFRHQLKEVRNRQQRKRKPRRPHQNLRSGECAETGSSSALV
ncbi:hypothetical protein PVK06_016743 [Gossypium arboreum]|uniref:Uncharacterized protein n=1 Tax=Gossypium arboreum TaxID=29729 RepID=A0ABR0Q0U0_GOSAR|nr:hypothetical protein PVK06_016743 [Gossypium arboreum]